MKTTLIIAALGLLTIGSAGCDHDPTSPDTAPSMEQSHDVLQIIAAIPFPDGSSIEFSAHEGGVALVTTEGEASQVMSALRRQGMPDPLSVYVHLTDAPVPAKLREIVAQVGISEPTPIDLVVDKSYMLYTGVIGALRWEERYIDWPYTWSDETGNFDRSFNHIGWFDVHVHARQGDVRVKVEKRETDWAGNVSYPDLTNRPVYYRYTLQFDYWTAFTETFRVTVTQASGDLYHVAVR